MVKSDEIIKTMEQYFSTDGKMHYFGDDTAVTWLNSVFASSIPYVGDAPDMFFKKGELVIIIEHFEFDCYRATKKGSSFRREEARIQRAFDSTPMSGNSLMIHDEIHGQSSYADYLNNVKRSFAEHYARIDQYIENLTEAGAITVASTVKVVFLIDDVSPLGSIMIDNDAPWGSDATCIIELSRCKEFLDLLSSSPKVDYVIACSSFGSKRIVWFIDRDNIQEYYDHVADYESMSFLQTNPFVLTGKMLIPNEEINRQSSVDDEQ